jgi:putative nucleotidyltransferase with HDIG domain
MIPTVAECFQLMDRYRMLDNIRDHSIIVARVATLLGENLVRIGLDISVPLAVSAALLHDIGKTACLDNDRDHAAFGREICLEHGYDELAGIVGDHVLLPNSLLPKISENELVFYADKRVNHEQVVSLGEREEYILERYGNKDPGRIAAIRANSRQWREAEEILFAFLPFAPEEVAALIDPDPATCDIHREFLPESLEKVGNGLP